MDHQPTHHDPGPWKEISNEKGIRTIEVPNFEGFFHFVNRIGSERSDDHYLWRGHRRAEWEILSTLARSSRPQGQHLQLSRFFKAVARCTNKEYDLSNDNPKADENRLKLWSLGQHWGLKTPMIDFTMYPYFALFFAFAELDEPENKTRAVYALDGSLTRLINFEITETKGMGRFKQKLNHPPFDKEFRRYLLDNYGGIHNEMLEMANTGRLSDAVKDRICKLQHLEEKKKGLKLYNPSTNENPRIHSQGGLHVYTSEDISVESWVIRNHQHLSTVGGGPILTKVLIPNGERASILTSLNKMNVNYLTIFPDFEGAAKHCNMALEQGFLGRVRDY